MNNSEHILAGKGKLSQGHKQMLNSASSAPVTEMQGRILMCRVSAIFSN